MEHDMARKVLLAALAGLSLALGASGAASAQTFRPPTNDNYIDSAQVNAPGSRLDPTGTLLDYVNTSTATVQPLLYPDRPEPTTCSSPPGRTVNYGKTIWYDFFPHVDGIMALRANGAAGIDPVLGVSQYSRRTSRLQGRFLCQNDPVAGSSFETYSVEVARGRAYTVQVGGVNNSGGQMSMKFDFLPTALRADARLRAAATGNGIRVLRLTVTATRGSRITVSCTRRGCRRAGTRRTRRGSTVIRGISGRSLRAGSRLEIRVTRGGAIGRYLAFQIKRGNFSRLPNRCLLPGSSRARRRC
jgi:hypothetical protein